MTEHTLESEPQHEGEKEFFLYPVIRLWAADEVEATDKVVEAIFTAGVGEIPGWLPAPPTFEEKQLQRAAPDLLAALEELLEWESRMGGWDAPCWVQSRAAIARARRGR